MRSSTGGFTLVETVVGATIMAFLLMAVLTLLPGGLALVEKNKQTNIATYLAHDVLEQLAAQPFATLRRGEQSLEELVIPPPYSATAVVADVEGYPAERLKRIVVTVQWPYRDHTLTTIQELYVHSVRR